MKQPTRKCGPLEALKLKDHCEMCGKTYRDHRDPSGIWRAGEKLEPGFDPYGEAKTLCSDCRIGSAELLHEKYRLLLREAFDDLESAEMRVWGDEHPESPDDCTYCCTRKRIEDLIGKKVIL